MGNGLRVGSSSLVADLRDKTIIIIGVVVDSLCTAIRKVDRVRSLHNTSAIIGLCLVEGSSRVVISNSIVVAVGRHLSKVRGSIGSSTVGRGMGNDRGSMVSRGCMVSRGSMVSRGGIGRGSMDSMGERMTNHTSGTMESVGRVRD